MATTENSEQGQPLAVPLSDQLGPEERAKLDALLDHIYEYGTTAEGVLLRAAHLCQAARAAERELCAKLCEEEAERWRGEQAITDFRLCAARIRSEV